MGNRILGTSNVLCPECSQSDFNAFLAFIEDLASLPLIWRDWNFSHTFWNLNECPQCGRSLSVVPDEKNQVSVPIGSVIELFAVTEGRGARRKIIDDINKNGPISAEVGLGLRSGSAWEVAMWVAAAVASGVIGNMAYDIIKQTVLSARRHVLASRSQNVEAKELKSNSKQLTRAQAHETLTTARDETLAKGKPLRDGSIFIKQSLELSAICLAIDRLFEKQLLRWEEISDEELADLVAFLYERAKIRLEDVRYKGPNHAKKAPNKDNSADEKSRAAD